MPSQFQPDKIQCFRFISAVYHEQKQQVYLNYAFDHDFYFTEVLTFPNALPLTKKAKIALKQVLKLLHLVAGISYYKAALPASIKIETGLISEDMALFLQNLYLQGLGEFAYCNQINLTNRIHFPYQADFTEPTVDYSLAKQSIVPVGGGKDSVVSIELLKQAGQTPVLFSVGQSPIINQVMAVSDLAKIQVTRQLSSQLFVLNQQGAYNGHVPISAILANIMAASAILFGFDTVVMSNERSANVGNLSWQGQDINHQYSKSLAFEQDTQQQFKQVLPGFNYFSLLRPLSELHIAYLFSKAKPYHQVFSSCNRNFRIQGDKNHQGRWCLDCPKCRFVFLALAPFIPQTELIQIFGRNLLDDENQGQGFAALLGLDQHKPFECVGEIEESQVALYLLSQQDGWTQLPLVQSFVQQLAFESSIIRQKIQYVFDPSKQHCVPSHFLSVLNRDENSFKTVF